MIWGFTSSTIGKVRFKLLSSKLSSYPALEAFNQTTKNAVPVFSFWTSNLKSKDFYNENNLLQVNEYVVIFFTDFPVPNLLSIKHLRMFLLRLQDSGNSAIVTSGGSVASRWQAYAGSPEFVIVVCKTILSVEPNTKCSFLKKIHKINKILLLHHTHVEVKLNNIYESTALSGIGNFIFCSCRINEEMFYARWISA